MEKEKSRKEEAALEIEKLVQIHATLKSLANTLSAEISAGLREPNLGFGLKLDPKSFLGFSTQIQETEGKALLVLKSLQRSSESYEDRSLTLRESIWSPLRTKFLQYTEEVVGSACEQVLATYPDGHLRPQAGNNAIRAVIAASSFRQLQDVRLYIMSEWSRAIHLEAIEEMADLTGLISFSISTSFILEFCRNLQLAGKFAEDIAHNFPPSQ
mmetsp:Transcript_29413/g.61511  ORF Transcript_29413/g.61511 Transcript_29413/m.61511 type:complete len:213 (-) Transcript_29413:43-681(-)